MTRGELGFVILAGGAWPAVYAVFYIYLLTAGATRLRHSKIAVGALVAYLVAWLGVSLTLMEVWK